MTLDELLAADEGRRGEGQGRGRCPRPFRQIFTVARPPRQILGPREPSSNFTDRPGPY